VSSLWTNLARTALGAGVRPCFSSREAASSEKSHRSGGASKASRSCLTYMTRGTWRG
jgi:hypothetical protein